MLVGVCSVDPLAKSLMSYRLELGRVLFLQVLDDLVDIKRVPDMYASVHDLCPDGWVEPIHIFAWDGWAGFLFCTGAALRL